MYGCRGLARPGLARAVADTRMLMEAGLTGSYYEMDVDYQQGVNFADALVWMLLQVYQNPARDWRELRREFGGVSLENAPLLLLLFLFLIS